MNFYNYAPYQEARDGEIQQILTHISDCYGVMITENRQLSNNENYIRNVLVKDYLKNREVKKKLGISNYRFLPESPVINDDYKEIGRTDIEVALINHFDDDDAVYRIECKRLDGQYHLNSEYVKEGIMRFIDNKYESYFGVNGMLGFCISAFDIDANTFKINDYIQKLCIDNTVSKLTKITLSNELESSYTSEHSLAKDSTRQFTLYHVMFNFSTLIKK